MTDIVPSVSITALLNLRDGMIARYEAAHKAVLDAHTMLLQSPFKGVTAPYIELRKFSYQRDGSFSMHEGDSVSAARQVVDSSMWNYLLKQSGLWSFMDSQARDDWSKQVMNAETPPLTKENIEATFATIHATRFDMMERGIIKCFKSLSWDYKTNNPFLFGKKIILRYIQGKNNALDDLERFFHVVDEKPEPDHRTSFYFSDWDYGTRETEYMHIKRFKNGNGHLTFKRPELVEKLNFVLTKHFPGALPHNRNAE